MANCKKRENKRLPCEAFPFRHPGHLPMIGQERLFEGTLGTSIHELSFHFEFALAGLFFLRPVASELLPLASNSLYDDALVPSRDELSSTKRIQRMDSL